MSQHIENGRELLAQGVYDGAMAAFQQALSEEPGNVDALYGAAKTHALLGDPEAALASYREAMSLEPRGAELGELAELLLERNSVDEAKALLDRAIELDPDQASAYVFRAEIASREGAFDDADGLLRKAVRRGAELPPQHLFAFYQQWVAKLVQSGENERASEVAGKAAQAFDDVHLLILAAGAAEYAGERATALDRYKRALTKLAPGKLRTEILEKLAALV